MANFTPEQYVKEWQNRAGRAPKEARQLVRRTGQRMLKVAKQHMRQQIYSIPEDTDSQGRKKWVRTRALINAEKAEYAPDGSGVTLTNSMIYARSRHELGRDGRKTKRPAHWRDGIFQELREEVERDMAETRYRIMKGYGF
jgi:hypothetical protein